MGVDKPAIEKWQWAEPYRNAVETLWRKLGSDAKLATEMAIVSRKEAKTPAANASSNWRSERASIPNTSDERTQLCEVFDKHLPGAQFPVGLASAPLEFREIFNNYLAETGKRAASGSPYSPSLAPGVAPLDLSPKFVRGTTPVTVELPEGAVVGADATVAAWLSSDHTLRVAWINRITGKVHPWTRPIPTSATALLAVETAGGTDALLLLVDDDGTSIHRARRSKEPLVHVETVVRAKDTTRAALLRSRPFAPGLGSCPAGADLVDAGSSGGVAALVAATTGASSLWVAGIKHPVPTPSSVAIHSLRVTRQLNRTEPPTVLVGSTDGAEHFVPVELSTTSVEAGWGTNT